MTRYWIVVDGKLAGPYAPAELALAPGFGPASQLCAEGKPGKAEDWVKAADLPDLRESLLPAPAPAPAPTPAPDSLAAPSTEILIFDDEPEFSFIYQETLQNAGYSVEMFDKGLRVLELIQEKRPRVVILDIMMPGLDGLSACKAIKADPRAKDTKVVIVTARDASMEQARALRLGADAFLQKPVEIQKFLAELSTLAGPPSVKAQPTVSQACFQAWGPASPPVDCCVSIEYEGHLFIFDAGKGLAQLQDTLLATQKYRSVSLFITRCAPGRAEGLASFYPYPNDPSFLFNLYGPQDPDLSLADFAAKHIPEAVRPRASLHPVAEGELEIASSARLQAIYTNAPGTALAYRLQLGPKTVVYCPDSEVNYPPVQADYAKKLRKLCQGADLLVHNARYTAEDYPAHRLQGDSPFPAVVELGLEAGVQKLLLLAPDPSYDAAKKAAMQVMLDQRLTQEATSLECAYIRPGTAVRF